ncbi:hypothetical protein ACP70R_045472 [Stipagrostis hirtigluma subsp. patula]
MSGARRRLSILAALAVVLVAAATVADAGVTSECRRKLEATADMPLDADVFRVPPGYNTPQQVRHPGHYRRSSPRSPPTPSGSPTGTGCPPRLQLIGGRLLI